MPLSLFEKAANQFGNVRDRNEVFVMAKRPDGGRQRVTFQDHVGFMTPSTKDYDLDDFVYQDHHTVGDLCKYMHECIRTVELKGCLPPADLSGSGKGSFEEAITKEGKFLAKKGFLHLGRYPVASVMRPGDTYPIQVPSLPDYEGVFPDGRQFLIEAKVSNRSAFPIEKYHIKPKQVRHMLDRHAFNVPGWLMVHFTEREGKTFYEPQFTVAIPVKPLSAGGLPCWEPFADTKNKGAPQGSISREMAKEIGSPVYWRAVQNSGAPRPDLRRFFENYLSNERSPT